MNAGHHLGVAFLLVLFLSGCGNSAPNSRAEAEIPAAVEFYLGESEAGPRLKEAKVEGNAGELIYLHEKPVLTRDDIAEAQVVGDSDMPAIDFVFTETGKAKIGKATEENLGKRLAVVVNGQVMFAAVLRSKIADRARITFSKADVEKLTQAIGPIRSHQP